MLINHDDYARERASRDPEFAAAIRKRAIGLLDGSEEDRRIAFRILHQQLGLTEDQIRELERNKATA
jgi:hypothetical protein